MIDFDQNKLRNRILGDAEDAVAKNDSQRLVNLAQEAQGHYQLDLAHYLLARKAILENNPQEALSKIEESIGVNPGFYLPLSLKVAALIQKGDFQAAIEFANSTIHNAPLVNHAVTYFNKGVAYQRIGKPIEAKFCYLTAITLNDVYVIAYRNLLAILVQDKEWNDVIIVSQRIAEKLNNQSEFLTTTATFLLGEAEMSLKSGKLDLDLMLTKEARNLTETALRIAPEDAGAMYNLACSYAREGKRDEALKYLRTALELASSKNLQPGLKEHALVDCDFAKIKDDQEFMSLLR